MLTDVYNNILKIFLSLCEMRTIKMTVLFVKFMFSKKATKNYKILTVDLTLTK